MDSTETWLHIGHIVGFVMWVGGMLATLYLLRVHAIVDGPARDVCARQEGRTAMIMDLGATVAMACGFVMAFRHTPSEFKHGAWLHVKLTLVVVGLLGVHGFTRAQVKRFRAGTVKVLPRALPYVVLVAAAAIIVLGAHPTLLRK